MSVHPLRTQRMDLDSVDLSPGAQLVCDDHDGPVTVTVSEAVPMPGRDGREGGVRVYGDDDHGRHCTVFLLPSPSLNGGEDQAATAIPHGLAGAAPQSS